MTQLKVRFLLNRGMLDEQTPWPPFEFESLWAEKVGQRSVKLLNYPFYAAGVSFLDEVLATDVNQLDGISTTDGEPELVQFESVLKHSGHGTVRVILKSEDDRATAETAISEIERLGCTWESSDLELPTLSVDIPPEADQEGVMSILTAASSAKTIYIDVGFLAR